MHFSSLRPLRHRRDFFCVDYSPAVSSNHFQLQVLMPVNLGRCVISLGGEMRFSCVHCRDQSFQQIFFHIHTKYVLDQGLDTNSFLEPCSSICGHQGPNLFVSCVHSKPQGFQLIFFKFTPYIP